MQGRAVPTPTAIPVDKLDRLVGTPACPVLIDVRPDVAFRDDLRLVPSRVWRPAEQAGAWAHDLRGRSGVLACQNGHGLSHGTAAYLRQAGASAKVLGFEAAPFDIDAPGVLGSHRDEFCTFDVMAEVLGRAAKGLSGTFLTWTRASSALSDLNTLVGAS